MNMEILDYAKPLIVAERALKDMYNNALERRYDEAYEEGMQAIVEIRLALAALKNERDKQ
jgi:uncharacterized protein YbjQ (UPF0145 family)